MFSLVIVAILLKTPIKGNHNNIELKNIEAIAGGGGNTTIGGDDYGCMHVEPFRTCWQFPEMTIYGVKVYM